jgi:hypothetical protein
MMISIKTMILGMSGPRSLTLEQVERVKLDLTKISRSYKRCCWYVGDAAGVDELARELAPELIIYKAISREPWELQKRSKRLVDALAEVGGTLHVWINKPCPDGVTVNSWKSSGSWGTARYAVFKGVVVVLHWLIEEQPTPQWMNQGQLSLF